MTDGEIVRCDCVNKPHESIKHWHESFDLLTADNELGDLALLNDEEDIDVLATTEPEKVMLNIILRMIAALSLLTPHNVWLFPNFDTMFETYKDLIDHDRMIEYSEEIPDKVDWSLPEEECAEGGGRFTWEDVAATLGEIVMEMLDKHCAKTVKRKREGEETESAPPKSKKNVIIKP